MNRLFPPFLRHLHFVICGVRITVVFCVDLVATIDQDKVLLGRYNNKGAADEVVGYFLGLRK